MTRIRNENEHWFVVRTKQHAEKKVRERLIASGMTAFLPEYETIRQWSDRKKKVKVPLIPSHVFVCCSAQQLKQVYAVLGVVSVLSEFGKPAVVREHEIQNMRILCSLNLEPECVPLKVLDQGVEVEVTDGPFAGLVGVVAKNSKGMRVHIVFKNLGMALVLKHTQLSPIS